MRVTTSFPLGTLRDTPAEAEIIGDRVIHWKELQSGGDDEE
ncbi:MAG: hypothetical protein VXW36_05050 [Candidatus Thermoplasmatota archaeon]|nr:hypothetical protein [Candidatus Thermoplasmatota archaeon]